MRFINIIFCLLILLLGHSPLSADESDSGSDSSGDTTSSDDTTNDSDTSCDNDETPKKCEELVCIDDKWILVAVDCDKPEGSESPSSIIDNYTMDYKHNVIEYGVNNNAGCSPCGGGSFGTNTLYDLQVTRIHRPRQDWHRSSFGRSTFTNFDYELRLFYDDFWKKGQMLMFFDPQGNNQFGFYDYSFEGGDASIDGIFHDHLSEGKVAKMYDENMQFVTAIDAAAFVGIENHSGSNFLFEVVATGSSSYKRGRLIAITDLHGNTISLDYRFPRTADVNDDLDGRAHQFFDLYSITDNYGKSAIFHWELVNNNRWSVINRVEWPNGTESTYEYTEGVPYLTQVNHPDGSASTFAYVDNEVTQRREIHIDDNAAEASHIKKVVHLTKQLYIDPETGEVINNQRNKVRRVTDGAGDDCYRIWTANADSAVRYVYEGGNRLLRLNIRNTQIIRVAYALNYNYDPASAAPDLANLEFIEKINYSHEAKTQTGSRDVLGREISMDRSIDRITGTGAINSAAYPDGSTIVKDYNNFGSVTRFVDRLGRITEHSYDAKNNRLSTTRGVGTSEASTQSWTYNSRGQKLTETDANGNTTDFVYDAQGYLIKIIEPADHPGDARAQRIFAYDSAGRLMSSADALGRTTQYTYNDRNLLIETRFQDQSTETIVYGTGSAARLPVEKTDRTGSVNTIAYDAELRPAITTIAAGTPDEVQEVCTYYPGTDIKATCERKGELEEFLIDHQNRRTAVIRSTSFGKSLTSKTVYERSLDRKIFTEDPYGRREYHVFDVNDRLSRRVREAVPAAVILSDIDDPIQREAELLALTRDLSGNASYIITDYVYDAEGQLLSKTDPRGIRDTFSYDALGRRIRTVESAGTAIEAITETDYDAVGNVIAMRYPRHFSEAGDFVTTMSYNARNLLASKTEATGTIDEATESFAYFLDKRKASHTDFNGNVLSYAWGFCCARFQAVIDPAVTVDDSGQLKNPATIARHNDFGDKTHEAVVSDYDGSVFPTFSDPTNVTDIPDASTINETTTRYDARHRPIAQTKWFAALGPVDANDPPIADRDLVPVINANAPAAAGLTTTWTYDDDLTDGIGLDHDYAADLASLPITYGFGANGSAVAMTNPAGETTVIFKDALGRSVANRDPLGHIDVMEYDTVENGLVITTSINVLGHENSVLTDGIGRTIRKIDAEGFVTQYTYDANANMISYRDPNAVGQDCVFDERDRDVSCTDTVGDTTSRVYNAHNAIVSEIDALGAQTVCVFDTRDRKISCTDRIAATTLHTYDDNNNLLSITDAEGGETSYEYDARNLLVKEVFPQGEAGTTMKTYDYDGARRLHQRFVATVERPRRGEHTVYEYDAINRLMVRSYPRSRTTSWRRARRTNNDDVFAYDAASRLISAESNRYNNLVERSYDAHSRLVHESLEIDGQFYTIAYHYDAADRQVGIVYPNGKHVQRSYTDRNQLEEVQYDGGIISTSSYDSGMREITRLYGNGIQTTKTYRADNLIERINAPGILELSYDYDANKRKRSEIDTLRPEASQFFTYDSEDRLNNWNTDNGLTAQMWNLSLVGDWNSTVRTGTDPINETRSHTDVHEVTRINGQRLAYDFKGNLTRDRRNALYTWDEENKMRTSIARQETVNARRGRIAVTSYRYDALGRRVQKEVRTGRNRVSTNFICAGAQVLCEYENGTEKQSYVYASYIDEPVALINASNDKNYYHQNHLYSVEVITDELGSMVENYDYNSHGKMQVFDTAGSKLDNSIVNNSYGFTGRRLDEETGLYYFRARYFDDRLGRFISRDSLGYLDGELLYMAYFIPNKLDFTGLTALAPGDPAFDPEALEDLGETTCHRGGHEGKNCNRRKSKGGKGPGARYFLVGTLVVSSIKSCPSECESEEKEIECRTSYDLYRWHAQIPDPIHWIVFTGSAGVGIVNTGAGIGLAALWQAFGKDTDKWRKVNKGTKCDDC